jgi:hypothetical protein
MPAYKVSIPWRLQPKPEATDDLLLEDLDPSEIERRESAERADQERRKKQAIATAEAKKLRDAITRRENTKRQIADAREQRIRQIAAEKEQRARDLQSRREMARTRARSNLLQINNGTLFAEWVDRAATWEDGVPAGVNILDVEVIGLMRDRRTRRPIWTILWNRRTNAGWFHKLAKS